MFRKEAQVFQERGWGRTPSGGARVQQVFAKAGAFALAFLVMLVFAAMAGLGVGLSAVSLRSAAPSSADPSSAAPSSAALAAPSAAEIVASRFPSADAILPSQAVTFSTASVMPVEHWERFDLDALSGMATADPAWP